jgi:hypothetical protein
MKALTLDALRAAGWAPGRRIDSGNAERLLLSEGYAFSPETRAFVEEFGGLRVRFVRANVPDEIFLDPSAAVGGICRERVETYEPRTGTSLVPVGEVYRRHMIVMLGASGALYGAYDDVLIEFGASVDLALEAITLDRPTRDL